MEFDFDTWICPCGYVMTDTEMQACRFDYGCPRCRSSFFLFTFQRKASSAKNHTKC